MTEPPSTTIRIAHLSDLHLGPLPTPRLTQLLSKRAFGFVNWHRRRRSPKGMAMLEQLVADCHAAGVDMTVITGDFVNIALPQEFEQAKAWLIERFSPGSTMAVLGNHDAYVPGGLERAQEAFAAYLEGTEPDPLPVRRIGGTAVLGVNTAAPRPPHLSSGAAGPAERDALAAALRRHSDAFKIVLIHYPPDISLTPRPRRLDDCDEVRGVIAEGGADLVLHGHNHMPSSVSLTTKSGIAPVIGVEAGSSDGTRHPPAAYNIYTVSPATGTVEMEKRIATSHGVETQPAVRLR